MLGNDVFGWLYDNLEDAYQSGEDYIKQQAQTVADSVTASVEWIWEALQGDFNEDMTTGQIAANAVLGLIPVVDQILDCRDVVANCKQINKDKTDTWAWVALCLTLIGLIPTLGSAVKGVLKILFLYLRKAGGDVAKVITPALRPIFAFLSDPKVKKILGNKGPKEVLLEVSIKLNELAGSINTQQLLGLFDQAIQAYRSVASKIGRIAPNSVQTWLRDSNRILQEVRDSADEMIESVVGMVQDTLKKSADEIKHQADELDDAYKALPDGKVVHQIDDSLEEVDPKFIKGSKLIPPDLPEFHIKNFLDRNVSARLTDGNEVFYKYHGETNLMGKTHNYVTNKLYTGETLLREELAILDEWGVKITHVTEFKPNKGTWVHEGKAAPQKGEISDEVKRGLGYQGLIDINDLTDETIVKTTKLPEGF